MLRQGDLLQNGRYRIEEDQPIGKGGQGSVYKAADFNLNIMVAIKEAEMKSPVLRDAFKREAQKLASLSHSGLPNGSNYFEEGSNQYLVMAYIEGLDFAQRLKQRRQPFSVPDVLKWADSLLDVVIYFHSLKNPLIHRDIKPANLKLDAYGRVILLDLGIATGGLTQLTRFPGPIGYTQGYAPPEQENGGSTDERTDIYAIGATLYHLLTYQRPPRATERQNQQVDPLQRADQLNPQVPRALADLLAEAMALDPAQRPASAILMRARLDQLSHPPTALPLPPPPPQPLPPPPPQPTQPPYIYRHTTEPTSPGVELWRRLIAATVAVLLAILFVGILLTAIGGEANTGGAQATATADEPIVVEPTSVPASPTKLITQNPEPTASKTAPAATPTLMIEATQPHDSANSPAAQPPALLGTPIQRPVSAVSTNNVQQITQLARFGKGEIAEIAYSPDGSLLAAASHLGVYIYNAETLEQVRFIETNHLLSSVAFSADGQLVAAGGQVDPTIHLWRVSDGLLVNELLGHQRTVNSVLFSPDGQTLASAANDGTVRLWNVSDGTSLRTLEGHNGGVTSLAFDPTGQILVSGSYDFTAKVWQTDDGQLLGTLEGHSDWVRGVAVDPNSLLIATSSQDGTVNIWEEETLLYTLSDFSGQVESIAFSPDGQILATASYYDEEISLWQTKDGSLLETLEQAGVSDLIFSPDGNTLATTFWGHSVELWRKPADQAQGFASFNKRTDHSNGMTSVALSPDGQFVASGSYDQRVRVWDLEESRLLGKFAGHLDLITSVAFSGFTREGERVPYLTSGAINKTVIVWNNGEIIDALEGHEDEVTSVAFQKDGLTVASGSNDNTVRLWRSDRPLHTFNEHTDEVTSVIFNKSGQHVISGSKDKTVRVWKVEEGTLVRTFSDLEAGVTSVAEANNDEWIAAGLENGMIVVWRDNTRLGTLEGHQDSVNAISFTADGKLLASGSDDDDGTIMLWNIEDGTLQHTLDGHNSGITALMFSLDGTQLVSSSYDGTVRLWGIRP